MSEDPSGSDDPLDVLEAALGEAVTVQLKDGSTVHGTLSGFDQHMNLVLEAGHDAEPAVGSVDNTTVIRGDNVVSIQR